MTAPSIDALEAAFRREDASARALALWVADTRAYPPEQFVDEFVAARAEVHRLINERRASTIRAAG